jgi:ankyrin repeat protein
MSDQTDQPAVPGSESKLADAPANAPADALVDTDQDLLDAAQIGDLPKVKRLIDNLKVQLTARNSWGETALHLAARFDHPEVVEELLAHNADVNAQDDDNWTPLYGAIEEGRDKVIQSILDKAGSMVDFSLSDSSEQTPLYLACFNGYYCAAKMILDHGGISTIDIAEDTGSTPLQAASYKGSTEVVQLLLQNKARMDLQNEKGWTALHQACYWNRHDVVKQLLESDPATVSRVIDIQDSDDATALHLASTEAESSTVGLLLQKGARMDLRNSNGRTALHRSCYWNRHDVVKQLLESDPATVSRVIDIQDSDDATALHLASTEAESNTVDLLLQKGARMDLQNSSRCTALHLACAKGQYDVVNLLLKRDADINSEDPRMIDIQDSEKKTALHHAIDNDKIKIVELLLEYKPEINLQNLDKQTALHVACYLSLYDVVELLLKYAASIDPKDWRMIDIQDSEKKTALHIAVNNLDSNIVELLLKYNPKTNLTDSGEETALQLAAWKVKPEHIQIFTAIAKKTEEHLCKRALVLAAGRKGSNWVAIENALDSLKWTNLGKEDVHDAVRWVWEAAKETDENKLIKMLRQKATHGGKLEKKYGDWEQWHALQWAAYLGNYVVVWWLLKSSASDANAAKCRKEAMHVAQKRRTELRKERSGPGEMNETDPKGGGQGEAQTCEEDKDTTNSFEKRREKDSKKVTEKPPLVKSTAELGPKAAKDEMNKADPKGKWHDEKEENLDLTIDMLKDPPLQRDLLTLPYRDDPYELPSSKKEKIGVDAAIMDFFKVEEGVAFLRRSRDVSEVIYNDGPNKIMQSAKETLRKISSSAANERDYQKLALSMRWIHLPSNDVSLRSGASGGKKADKL